MLLLAITTIALVAAGLMVSTSSPASAQGAPASLNDDTPGVWLHAAGLSSPADCLGDPAGARIDNILEAAQQNGTLSLVGSSAGEVRSYTSGTSAETPNIGEIDTTTAEVVTGLSAIDDFGQFSNGDDDSANVDTGTGGAIRLDITGPQVLVADGVISTGVPGSASDSLDGAEIFILEDAELSGYTITLVNDAGFSTAIAVDDLQLNPATRDGADDIVVAIDLDTVPGWTGAVTEIALRDDGILGSTVDSCTSQGLLDSSLEIDAVLVKKSDPFVPVPVVTIEKTTDGVDADAAPGPTLVAGESVFFEYTISNIGNVDLESLVVADSVEDSALIDCGTGSNTIDNLPQGRTVVCGLTATVNIGAYENTGTVTAQAVGFTVEVSDSDLSHYTGVVPARSTIGDTVWVDLDGSGTQNGTESGIENVTVTLSGPASGSTVTDANGNYLFSQLPPGDYTIAVDAATLPAGFVATFDLNGPANGSSTETLAVSASALDHDFGYAPAASVAIEASTNGSDADTAPGVTVEVGSQITWTYTVTNTGPITVTDAVVLDAAGASIDCGGLTANVIASLTPGQTVTCAATGTASLGAFATEGTVTANAAGGQAPGASDPTNYTGVPRPVASIGSVVWIDTNQDGVQQSTEAGVPGITVNLVGPGGPQSLVTDTAGNYLFNDLDPGTYTVTMGAAPLGFAVTADPEGAVDGSAQVVLDGADVLDVDFGYSIDASIDIETATNGAQSDTAPGNSLFEGTSLEWSYVVTNTGTAALESIVVNDSELAGVDCGDGTSQIASLAPGASAACVLTGSTVTLGAYQNIGSAVGVVVGAPSIAVDDSDATNHLGVANATGVVTGRAWTDANRNGVRDAGEADAGGGLIVRLLSADGATLVAETVTSVAGTYSFTGLAAGSYSVQIIPAVGQVLTPANIGPDDTVDSDFDTATGLAGPIVLAAAETRSSVDAGLADALAIVGGLVWNDEDEDGVRSGESSRVGVTVNLLSVDGAGAPGQVLDTAVTTADGYRFEAEPSLDYFVQIETPSGLVLSPQNAGANDAVDSDFDAGALAPVTNLTSGEERLTIDAGVFEPVVVPSTATPVPATATPVPSTATPVPATATPVPATATATPVPATPVPSTATPVPATPVPSTATPVPASPVPSTATPVPASPVPATATPVPATATGVASPTAIPTSTATPTPAPGTVSGSVIADANNNGTLDDGEEAATGLTIRIFAADESGAALNQLAEVTTDDDGRFEINDLPIDASYILMVVPARDQVIAIAGPDNNALNPSGMTAVFELTTDEPTQVFAAAVANAQVDPEPTTEPTVEATVEPTTEPTVEATVEPTTEPTAEPTAVVPSTTTATATPVLTATAVPTATAAPTSTPTAAPAPTATAAARVLGATTAPTAAPTVTPQPTSTPVPATAPLALTGSNAGTLASLAVVLVLTGIFVLLAIRNRRLFR